MKKIFLIFMVTSLWAQPPEWNVDSTNYEHVMSLTAVVFNEEIASDDVLGAFNEQNECVGVSVPMDIPFGPFAGQKAFLIQILSLIHI